MKAKEKRDWSWFRDGDIKSCLSQCREILNLGFASGAHNPVIEGSLRTQLLIDLSDLLQKADDEGARVAFTDHINASSNAKDVTDLIKNARNAVCHVNSGLHLMSSNNKLRGPVVRGYSPRVIQIGDEFVGCDYADDVALIYGNQRVYVKRHIERAFNEVKKYFENRFLSERRSG
ncbi:hypothetical protein [Robbsia andropogonis]|uniref:hypothetical protein n=1 Tax=Robbsia andropogonis TaxID=28092 RepID=UPI00209D5568|nr:hypothetical protein [Robbsia andropogonis]MCP1116994.1 hypothetical protein [Robbsia andropogonis]MCP1126327.1 hypothetical protein [Robbsia andropogonis]